MIVVFGLALAVGFTGMVLALQAANSLSRFGAKPYTGSFVGLAFVLSPMRWSGPVQLTLQSNLSETRVDIAVLGVPYDLATTGRSGTREGPLGVRRASWQISWEERRWPWRFALADRLGVIDYGDVIFDPGNHQQMVDVLQNDARWPR